MTTQVSESEMFQYTPLDVVISCPTHGEQKIKVPSRNGIPITQSGAEKCPECRELDEVRLANTERKTQFTARVQRAEIPLRYASARLRDLEDSSRQMDVVRKYATNFPEYLKAGESLILTGPTGTGKTHAAVAVMMEIIAEHRRETMFKTVLEVVRAIRSTWSRDSKRTEDQVITTFVTPDLLVIDDVGVQYGTENEKLLLFEIINRRYNNLRPMLLTSNLDLDELKAYLGDRMVDRITEGRGGCLVINGESRRGGS